MLLFIFLMMRVLFTFLLKLNSHHLWNRHWSRITVLRATATVLKTYWNSCIQIAFNRVIPTWKNWHKKPLRRARFFERTHFALKTRKIIRSISFQSITYNTIKKLQWIPNTIMNISVLEYFDNVYVSYGVKIALSTHGLGNV